MLLQPRGSDVSHVPYFSVYNVHPGFSTNDTWGLVLPMCDVHPYCSPHKCGQKCAHSTQQNTVFIGCLYLLFYELPVHVIYPFLKTELFFLVNLNECALS